MEEVELTDLSPVEYTPGDEDYTLEEQRNEDYTLEEQQQVADDNDGPTIRGDKLFEGRYFEYKTTTHLFELLVLEDECKNPKFIKWLMDRKDFKVERVMSKSKIITDYKFEYLGDDQHVLKQLDMQLTDKNI